MNIIIAWAAICLASGGLGLIGGLWLASHRHARGAPPARDKAATEDTQAYVKSLFDAQSLALDSAHQAARDAQAKALEQQPLMLQKTLETELARYAALQASRDEATAAQLEEFKAEQQRSFAALEAASTVQLGNFLKALATMRAKDAAVENEAAARPRVATESAAAAAATTDKPARAKEQALPPPSPAPLATAVSARPPELLLTPIQPPTPADEPEAPACELSDAELDAMPPELPQNTPRRRVLPAPKSPAMGRL